MKSSAHRSVSVAAVKEAIRLLGGGENGFAATQLRAQNDDDEESPLPPIGPDEFAVTRDFTDVFTRGHWLNFGQKHHFMRRRDNQTPYQGWHAACEWIHTNLVGYTQHLAKSEGYYGLMELGDAFHAIEDSFATPHVTRSVPPNPNEPGIISYIEVYTDQDSDEHSDGDVESGNDPRIVSLATKAVVDVILLAFKEAKNAQSRPDKKLHPLQGWAKYRDYWLKPSPTLDRGGGHNVDLIDAHIYGISLDERGLAKSLYQELGGNSGKVLRVFSRLDKYDNSNAGQVARYYTSTLMQAPQSEVTHAVARDIGLHGLLLSVLSTDPHGEKYVSFLRTLRRSP